LTGTPRQNSEISTSEKLVFQGEKLYGWKKKLLFSCFQEPVDGGFL